MKMRKQHFRLIQDLFSPSGITALLAAQARGFQHIAKLLLKFDTKGTEFKDRENHVTKKVDRNSDQVLVAAFNFVILENELIQKTQVDGRVNMIYCCVVG